MIKKICANLLDEMILFGVAVILLFVTKFILGAAGFKIMEPAVFLTAYLFISNVFYFPIMENSKGGSTLGRRALNIDGTAIKEEIKEEKV